MVTQKLIVQNRKALTLDLILIILALIIAFLPTYLFYSEKATSSDVLIAPRADELQQYAAMQAWRWDYTVPWKDASMSFFSDVIQGSPYLLIPLGILAKYLKLDIPFFHAFMKSLFLFLVLVTLFFILKRVIPRHARLAFLTALFIGGAGASYS